MDENPYRSPKARLTPSTDEAPPWPIRASYGLFPICTVVGVVLGLLIGQGSVIDCAVAGAVVGLIADQFDRFFRRRADTKRLDNRPPGSV